MTDYRVLRIKFDKVEVTGLIWGIIDYFKDYDLLEVEKRGSEIIFVGTTGERFKKELGWAKKIGL